MYSIFIFLNAKIPSKMILSTFYYYIIISKFMQVFSSNFFKIYYYFLLMFLISINILYTIYIYTDTVLFTSVSTTITLYNFNSSPCILQSEPFKTLLFTFTPNSFTTSNTAYYITYTECII